MILGSAGTNPTRCLTFIQKNRNTEENAKMNNKDVEEYLFGTNAKNFKEVKQLALMMAAMLSDKQLKAIEAHFSVKVTFTPIELKKSPGRPKSSRGKVQAKQEVLGKDEDDEDYPIEEDEFYRILGGSSTPKGAA